MSKPTFDLEEAVQALRNGASLNGKDGILTPLINQLTEATLYLYARRTASALVQGKQA